MRLLPKTINKIGYVVFPSHNDAKDAHHRLHGKFIAEHPISLRIFSLGFFNKIKLENDALNTNREMVMGIAPRPLGIANPFFKPRILEKPQNSATDNLGENTSSKNDEKISKQDDNQEHLDRETNRRFIY